MMFEVRIAESLAMMQQQLSAAIEKIDNLTALSHSDYATVSEVAAMKGVSEEAIRKKIRNGDIDPMNDIRKNGRVTYIRRAAIPKISVRKKHY